MRFNKPGVRLRHFGRTARDWVVRNGKYHLVDTTALLTSTNPIYSASEVWIAGMSDKVSIDSRLTIAGISYTVMGPVFARGRDFSRKKFGISGNSSERSQIVHDIAYAAAFNLAVCPFIYLSMGADLKQALVGSISAAGLSVGMGPIMGYSVDVARDLTGLETCKRRTYPELLRRQNSKVKKGIATSLVAASIGLMSLVYWANPNNVENQNQEQPVTQQVSEISDVVG